MFRGQNLWNSFRNLSNFKYSLMVDNDRTRVNRNHGGKVNLFTLHFLTILCKEHSYYTNGYLP